MKTLVEFINEAMIIEKPTADKVKKIDVKKLGELIAKAGGDEAVLVYAFKNGYVNDYWKIYGDGTIKRQVYKNSEWKWVTMKDLRSMFQQASKRMTETLNYGVSDKDITDCTDKNWINQDSTDKLAKSLGIKSMYIGTNAWRDLFNALEKL